MVVALLGSACGGQSVPVPSGSASPIPTTGSSSPSTPRSPSSSPSSAPPASLQIEVPDGAPTTFARPLAVDEIPVRSLIAPDASVVSSWRVGQPDVAVPEVAIAWTRGADPFRAEHGFVLWQGFGSGPPWRVVYAFSDGPAEGVLGVRFETGDLTGDGAPDVLTFEDLGGSGACGLWRVVTSGPGSAGEIYRKQTCDTDVRISDGDLMMREALFAPGDAHCCPSRYRTTTLAWDGTAWQVVDKVVEPA